MAVKHSIALGLALALSAGIAAAQNGQILGPILRIGVINDASGPNSAVSGEGSVIGARMAAEEFGNKVLGVPIEIVSADHQNKADVGAGIARKWFDVDGVTRNLRRLQFRGQPGDRRAREGPQEARVSQFGNDRDHRRGLHAAFHPMDVQRLRDDRQPCDPTRHRRRADTLLHHRRGLRARQGCDERLQDRRSFPRASPWSAKSDIPSGASDFSSYLLQAQASGAKALLLADGGQDLSNAIKQAGEFQSIAENAHLRRRDDNLRNRGGRSGRYARRSRSIVLRMESR